MARLTARRRASVAVALVVALGALSVGAWALGEWKPFAHPSAEPSWPANIAPLARYVEDTTRVRFSAHVNVEFIADAQRFLDRVTNDDGPSAAALANSATDEGVGRALGFWSGEPHLADSAHLLRISGDTGVEWLPEEHVVVVRAKNEKAELSPIDRADLVMVLTEIADDQRYQLNERMDRAPTPQDFQVLAGLAIGEALWVLDRYTSRFDNDEAEAYRADRSSRGKEFNDAVTSVNLTFRSLRVASQTVGTAFVAALHRSSDGRAMQHAFTSAVPAAIDQMTMPVHKYAQRDPLEHVEPPAVPTGGEYLYTRQMGPFGVHLLLAGGVPPMDALEAADGWGNDSFIAYQLEGRVCTDARIVADDKAAADRIEHGLKAWAAARPAASQALVGRKDTTLLLSVCDPGAKAAQPTLDAAASDQFLDRADLLRDRVSATGQPALSECIAVRFYRDHAAADLRGANPDVNPFEAIDTIGYDCVSSV